MAERVSILFHAEDDTQAAVRAVRDGIESLKGSFESVSHTAESFKTIIESVFIGGIVGEGIRKIVDETVRSEQSFIRLNATLRATGYAAGLAAPELNDLAEALAKTTTFRSEDIREAETALLRFRDVGGETFKEVIKLATDWATVSGKTVPEAATEMGRALEQLTSGQSKLQGSSRGLQEIAGRLNPELLAQAQAFARNGEYGKAYQIVIDNLNKSIGGLAQAANTGTYGALAQTRKAWDDLFKTIGESKNIQFVVQSSLGLATESIKLMGESAAEASPKVRSFLQGIFDSISRIGGITGALSNLAAEMARVGTPPPRSRPVTGQVGGTEEERLKEFGRINQMIEQAEVKAGQDKRQRDALQISISRVNVQNSLDLEREQVRESEQIWKDYYDRGLVSIEAYYVARKNTTEAALREQIRAINIAIVQEQKAAKNPELNPDQQNQAATQAQRLLGQRTVLQTQLGFVSKATAEQQINDEQKYADAIAQVNIELLQQQSRAADAAGAQFALTQRTNAARIASQRDPQAREALDRLGRQLIIQGQINDAMVGYNTERDKEATTEQRIANALTRSGGSPDAQLSALRATNAARLASLPALRATADELERLGKAQGGPAGAAQVAAAEKLRAELDGMEAAATGAAEAFAKLQITQQKAALASGEEALAEQRVQTAVVTGQITELEGLQALDKARKDSLPALQEIARIRTQQAEASGNAQAILEAKQFQQQVEALGQSADNVGLKFRGIFQTNFVTALDSFILKTRSASQAFNDFAKNIVNNLVNIADQKIAQIIFGNLLGGTISGFGNIFASGLSAGTPSYGMGYGSGGGLHFATGGAFTVGGSGGTDSQLVQFMATPGEKVSVNPPGQSGGSTTINIQIDAGGSKNAMGSGDASRLGDAVATAVQSEIIRQKMPGGALSRNNLLRM